MPAPRVPISDLPEQTVPTDTDLLVVQNGITTKKMTVGRLTTQSIAALNAHLTDLVAAHAATAVSAVPNAAPMTGTDVQGQLTQAASRLAQLTNVDNTTDANKPISTATQTALNLKADKSSVSNVDNTSDANKPISTATQTALNAKADKSITIATTAPLAGGGDLSTGRTLSVTDFTSATRGTVPASGGGTTNYLRADGTWAPMTATGSMPVRWPVQYTNAAPSLVLTLSDENTMIINGYPIADVTCPLPSNATTAFPLGAEIQFVNNAPGTYTIIFSAGSGATVQSRSNMLKAGVKNSVVHAKKISVSGWLLWGDLVA